MTIARLSNALTLPIRLPHVLTVVALLFANGFEGVAKDDPLDAAAVDEPPITEDDRDHWAFRPLVRPRIPAVESPWIREPIDCFIIQRLNRMQLLPMPTAQRTTLLRRLYFDLTGLPPSPAQITTYISDQRPDAYQRLVDRLLASPQYGEHWGQYWLDLARFAETDGFEHDNARPNAWRYRDWVVQAFNADVPYDQMVRAQLAGDLSSTQAAEHIATGFALCGPDMPDINDSQERRHFVLNELTSTVGSVFLGLQIGCAQCHDHKYDPISQADFYRLRAFFDSSLTFKDRKLQNDDDVVECRSLQQGQVRASYLMVAGDYRRRGAKVFAAFPRIANPEIAAASHTRPDRLRLQLARWLTQKEHALATRVIVNRVWQYHFGTGLVRTPSDFGLMGDEPRHPELLDWLATELPRSDWSLKRLHRLIVNSATYRQASGPSTASGPYELAEQRHRLASTADADNRFLARQNRRRLGAEAIRDSLLFCSERLCLVSGGPGVMPPLPEEIRKSIRADHWQVSLDPQDHVRRSVYLFVRRNLRYPFLEVFDRPDANASCARRTASTVAPQSLALLNSDWSTESAQALAKVITKSQATTPARVNLLFLKTLSREPSEPERAAAYEFLRTAAGQQPRNAMAQLSLAMFNLNEFIYID